MQSLLLVLAAVLSTQTQAQAPAPAGDPRPEKGIGVKTDVPGALRIEEPQLALAPVHQGGSLEHRFAFTNAGPGPVLIEEGVALSGTGSVEFHPARVPPGATGEILVRQPVGDRLGRVAFRFALVTDEPGVNRYRMGLTSFVESAYDPERPRLDFGVVDKGASRTVEAEVLSREVETLQVLEPLDGPAFLRLDTSARAGLSSEGVRLRATLEAARAPLGLTHGTLRLRTNVPGQPECFVAYSFDVVGDVLPSADVLSLGLVRLGDEATAEMSLVSRSGRTLEVTAVEDPANLVTTETLPCPPDRASPGCRVLRVRHKAVQRGVFTGVLSIRIAGEAEPLSIRYSGIVISPQARVKDVDMTRSTGPEEDAGPMSSEVPAPAAPLTAPAPAEEPAPAASAVGTTLRWKARREADIYGYLVYRSERPSGPFTRASREIIRAEGGSGEEVRSYSFVDADAQPGRTYYYYVDVVDGAGLKRRFSGVKARQISPAP